MKMPGLKYLMKAYWAVRHFLASKWFTLILWLIVIGSLVWFISLFTKG